MKKICNVLLISTFLVSALGAQISFSKVTDAEPVKKIGDWRSVNWIDYNNDFLTLGQLGGY